MLREESVSVRFVAAPRSVINAAVGEMAGWQRMGDRILARATAICPVSEREDGGDGPHLKDSLEKRIVTGVDPRILIGSKQTVAGGLSKLALVVDGTDPHPIDPVNASVLRFTSGGQVVFAAHVDHPGTQPNNFVLEAIKSVCQEGLGDVA